jgi:hypothetical protein
MNKKMIILLTIVLVLIIVGVIWLLTCREENRILEYNIIRYIEENYKGEHLILSLSDFTNFEWDYGLVLRPPTSDKEVSDALDIEYTRGLDLMHGIIFVKDGVVIHEEFFRVHLGFGATPIEDTFIIDLSESGVSTTPYRVFDRETQFKFIRVVEERRDGSFISYRGFPLSALNETEY